MIEANTSPNPRATSLMPSHQRSPWKPHHRELFQRVKIITKKKWLEILLCLKQQRKAKKKLATIETLLFTAKSSTQELSPKEMACKAESCGRKRGRSWITFTESWRFQRAISPFGTITMEFERNTRVQEKVKRNEGKKVRLEWTVV